MKNKKWLVVLFAAMLAVLAACGGNNQSEGKDEKVLKVGATGQSYPFAYKDNGKLVGFDVEVTEAIAKKLGYKLDWQLSEFSGLMGQLTSGKLDTVSNQVAVTNERKQTFNFTDTYAYAGTQIIVKRTTTTSKVLMI